MCLSIPRFHVDKLSSAHVYLRMPTGMSFDDLPVEMVAECGQLVKANSIEGIYIILYF